MVPIAAIVSSTVLTVKGWDNGVISSMLLVAQRLNRIQVGRFPRGIDAEDKSHRSGGDEGEYRPVQRHGGRKRWKHRWDDRSDERAQQEPDHSADGGQHDSFKRELHEDVALAGAHGFAHSDFARALGHRNQNDVHYAHTPNAH